MDDGPNRSNEKWLQTPEMPCFGSENRIGREEKETGKLGFERLAYCVLVLENSVSDTNHHSVR